MSRGSLIPVTLMTTSSGLSVSVLYRRIVEDSSQTTYMMLSRYVTPRTPPTTYNMYTALYDMTADDDFTWISHSCDVKDYVEWTECVRVVQTDCGGPLTDNIHDVV